jgi:hypothetical protein
MNGSPIYARAWTVLLLLGIALQLTVILGPWPQETVDTPLMQALYAACRGSASGSGSTA